MKIDLAACQCCRLQAARVEIFGRKAENTTRALTQADESRQHSENEGKPTMGLALIIHYSAAAGGYIVNICSIDR